MSHPIALPMDYVSFDAAPFGFPAAALPALPVLRRGALNWPAGAADAADAVPAWGRRGRFYKRARYALRDAFALSGVGPAGGLLAPAYHCRTMLDPAIDLGAPIDLFELQPDLKPVLPALEAQLVRAAVPVRAVLMPQYFGLRQDMSALSRLCQRHGAALVEDCSHALPLTRPDNHMGLSGTYAISSPYKFFPCPDGGVLWSNTGQDLSTLARLQWPGLRTELRHWAGLRAQARQRAPAHATTGQVEAEPFSEQAPACDKLWRGSEPSPDYRPADCVQACSLTSRALIALTDIPALLARRRSHYNTWVDATADLAGAQAFNPQLSADDTPYMFPLLLRDPQRHFAKLKHAGLPIFRWDSLARSTCATSAHYRLHLLHLPCHQALRDTDLDWMISTLRRVLQGASTSARA